MNKHKWSFVESAAFQSGVISI